MALLTRMIAIEPSSPEWHYLWSRLGADRATIDPISGEGWQYMGTVIPPEGLSYHELVHPLHPAWGKRIVRKIPASPFFVPPE